MYLAQRQKQRSGMNLLSASSSYPADPFLHLPPHDTFYESDWIEKDLFNSIEQKMELTWLET